MSDEKCTYAEWLPILEKENGWTVIDDDGGRALQAEGRSKELLTKTEAFSYFINTVDCRNENRREKIMEQYLGTKLIKATPMTRLQYNEYRGWKLPKDENPCDKGYLVEYQDGYISWTPEKQFNDAYRRIGALTFGLAVEALKLGKKVARAGWNGKGMFVVYQKAYPQGIACNKQTAQAWGISEGDLFRCEPYLQIKMTNGSHSMWVPSINDVLAEDWTIVE